VLFAWCDLKDMQVMNTFEIVNMIDGGMCNACRKQAGDILQPSELISVFAVAFWVDRKKVTSCKSQAGN
jgi:hypothetical protein